MVDALKQQIRQAALNYLARREHTAQELRFKLQQKGFAEQAIDPVLHELAQENYLSHQRFVEEFVRSRIRRGDGQLKIQHALKQRGLSEAEWAAFLDIPTIEWVSHAIAVRQQRFGETLPQTPTAKLKQSRFLHNRGFTAEQIKQAVHSNDVE